MFDFDNYYLMFILECSSDYMWANDIVWLKTKQFIPEKKCCKCGKIHDMYYSGICYECRKKNFIELEEVKKYIEKNKKPNH